MNSDTNFSELLFELNVKHYNSYLLSINANFLLQILLNLISTIMIYGNFTGLKIPFFEVFIHTNFLHFIVPYSLLASWLQFGFQFNNAIETRHISMRFIHSETSMKDYKLRMSMNLF